MAFLPPVVSPVPDAKSKRTFPIGVPASTNHCVNGGATNTACTISLSAATTAGTVGVHHVSQVSWSYSATATTGRLTIMVGGTTGTVHDQDIIAGGPGQVQFNPPLALNAGTTADIILSAVAAITGKLNATLWTHQ